MTNKETQRLKIFINTYGSEEINSNFWVIDQSNNFHNVHTLKKQVHAHAYAKDHLANSSFLTIPFNQIKRINLWICTEKGVFYF